MEEVKKILGIPYTEFGTTIKMAGMVLEGLGEHYVVIFPETRKIECPDNIDVRDLDHEGWKELLHQLDVVQVEVLDPAVKGGKIILRKSQREIEQSVNWNVFKRDGYKCRYCGNDSTPLTVDHIILWEKMGPSIEDNLITACRKCNKTRGNMEYGDWLKSEYYHKVMKIWADGADMQNNLDAGEKAKKVPLRVTKRGR